MDYFIYLDTQGVPTWGKSEQELFDSPRDISSALDTQIELSEGGCWEIVKEEERYKLKLFDKEGRCWHKSSLFQDRLYSFKQGVIRKGRVKRGEKGFEPAPRITA